MQVPDNTPYMVAAYYVTAVVILTYAVLLVLRTRNAAEMLTIQAEEEPTHTIPDRLGFNWGAFFLGPLWLVSVGKWPIGILWMAVNSVVSANQQLIIGWFMWLVPGLYFGFQGNKMAWQKHRYTSRRQLKVGQRLWNLAGIYFGVVMWIPLMVLLFIIL